MIDKLPEFVYDDVEIESKLENLERRPQVEVEKGAHYIGDWNPISNTKHGKGV